MEFKNDNTRRRKAEPIYFCSHWRQSDLALCRHGRDFSLDENFKFPYLLLQTAMLSDIFQGGPYDFKYFRSGPFLAFKLISSFHSLSGP
jgi:hypothetical protein